MPLGLGDVLGEGGPGIGEDPAQPVKEPFHLLVAAEEDAAQHAARDACGMRLGIGQRQGGAPGAAEEQPFLNAEEAPQRLDVLDQMRRGVGAQLAQGARAAGAALVEDDQPPMGGIEKAAMHGPGAGTGAAMQEEHGLPARIAHLLPIHHMPLAQGQQARLEGGYVGKEITARHGELRSGHETPSGYIGM